MASSTACQQHKHPLSGQAQKSGEHKERCAGSAGTATHADCGMGVNVQACNMGRQHNCSHL